MASKNLWAVLIVLVVLGLTAGGTWLVWGRQRKEGYKFTVSTSWGGNRKCRNGRHFRFTKRRNGKCPQGYKDTQDNKKKPCYRCANNKEQRKYVKDQEDVWKEVVDPNDKFAVQAKEDWDALQKEWSDIING